EDLVIPGILSPRGIAIDATDGTVYWTDTSTGKIQRAAMEGVTITYDPDGQFEFLANGEEENDFFIYKVTDGIATSAPAIVSVAVKGANDAPTAVNDSGLGFSTDENSATTTPSVLENDIDPDGSDSLFVDSVDTSGTLGIVTDNGDGTFNYDPNDQFESLGASETATDGFDYVASDGMATSTASVVIEIRGVNDAPVADAGADKTVVISDEIALQGTATDIDSLNTDLITLWNVVDGPGVVTFDDASSTTTTVIFASTGTYELRLTVDDGDLSDFDDLTITVDPGSSGGGGASIRPVIAFVPESLTFGAAEDGENPEPQVLRVSTSKNRSTLRFTISTDVAWLRATPIEGVSDATNDRERITVSVDISGLDVGSHTGEITISARRASNDPRAVPVTLVISTASGTGVISEIRFAIDSSEATVIVTPDEQVQMTIPRGALPEDEAGDVEVEIKNVDIASLPDAPDDTVFVRAIELNTLVNGKIRPVTYDESIELVFFLTEADLALVEGDASRLGVLWYDEETGLWDPMPATYRADPPPAGSLVIQIDHFSLYAVGVIEAASEVRQVTEKATPASTSTPKSSAVRIATREPSPTAQAFVTPTRVPTIPTAIAVSQATPSPTPAVTLAATPQPTAAPTPTTSAVPAATAPLNRPPVEPTELPVLAEQGGVSTTTLALFGIVGIAVLTVVAAVAQGIRVRRRKT
ncbi:MAG: cadherin-like domain-containing protein, partial [Chloroflexi bacterium]|nr:cadherin-like domain-containing protein [Chloroflexota bacterium]